MHVQTHRDAETTWIIFDEACNLFQWEHLPRDHIIGKNTHIAWVCWPNCGWVDISSGEKKRLGEIYQFSDILAKRLAARIAAE